jgi:hypothetical protein
MNGGTRRQLDRALGVPRAGPTAVANGKIYRMGGNAGGVAAKPFQDVDAVDCWEYDPASEEWSRPGMLTQGGHGDHSVPLASRFHSIPTQTSH